MSQRHNELKELERKVCVWLQINGIAVDYMNTGDMTAMFIEREGMVNTKKCVLCWNDFKNEYVIYDLDEWDSYLRRWHIKSRKELIQKMSM